MYRYDCLSKVIYLLYLYHASKCLKKSSPVGFDLRARLANSGFSVINAFLYRFYFTVNQ